MSKDVTEVATVYKVPEGKRFVVTGIKITNNTDHPVSVYFTAESLALLRKQFGMPVEQVTVPVKVRRHWCWWHRRRRCWAAVWRWWECKVCGKTW